VSTLYFEIDTGDGFREPGFSKERRLLTWLKLVRTFDSAVDGGEGVAEVVG